MPALNLVNQLCFARSEFHKGFSSVSEEEGFKRLPPMNSIGWIVGHLAWHEQSYWLKKAQGIVLFQKLQEITAFGKPAGDASLNEMTTMWETVTREADNYLDSLTLTDLEKNMLVNGKPLSANIGTMILRMTYHYWYHNGEIQAIRQLLGHTNLPDFVSDEIETIGRFYSD